MIMIQKNLCGIHRTDHKVILYFLKKSGILMDCSFTLLEGVLG